MKNISYLALFFGLLLTMTGWSADAQTTAPPSLKDTTIQTNYRKTGQEVRRTAAIYDQDLDGSRTASGEMFHNFQLTAGSNEFPFNTWLLVTNTVTQRSVVLRINDKIPKKMVSRGVGIRLSKGAVDSIGIKGLAKTKLKLEVIVPTDSISFTQEQTIVLPVDTTPNTFRAKGKAITGIASFYSYNLDGTLTSTGERYRNAKFTAASNNFKLNTWVLVTNLRNKKSVIVRINDHMHPRMKAKGRVVDLSREAAKQLDFIDRGLTKVKVQPVEFIFSPEVKQQLDSVAVSDSTRRADSVTTATEEPDEAFSKTGIASFYSENLDGTLTATGERYRNNKMSAASNDFDLNTWVRITNLRNKKSVVLRINDRMHPRMKRKGRVVDLSRVAARKLGFMSDGLARVKVEIVDKDELE